MNAQNDSSFRATASRGQRRFSLYLQTSRAVKAAIERAARENHRSVAREVEHRLAQSFERDRRLPLILNQGDYARIFQKLAELARRVEQRMGKSAGTDIATARAIQAAWVTEIGSWWWHPDLPALATISAILRAAQVPSTDARPLSREFTERAKRLGMTVGAIFQEEWAAMEARAANALARAAAEIDR